MNRCEYCRKPCHVIRRAPGGIDVLMATCRKGMNIDRAISGHDHRTLVNPFTGRAERSTPNRSRRLVGARVGIGAGVGVAAYLLAMAARVGWAAGKLLRERKDGAA